MIKENKMIRELLLGMFIDIGGGENQVNVPWLNCLSDDEICDWIISLARLGKEVSAISAAQAGTLMAPTVSGMRRLKIIENNKGEQ